MLRKTSAPFCGIAVMAKASAPGRTKTRLCPPLTSDEAACINTSFLKDVAENILYAARHVSLAPYMAFAPAGSDGFFRAILPPTVGLIENCLGHFGDCLMLATEALFSRGHAAACVLNADSPTLPPAYLVELCESLAAPGDRAVIGPSVDGGYYLLALKAPHRRLFEDIAWSTEKVFVQTLARAAEISLPVHVLPAWYDVDDEATLKLLCGELFEDRPFSPAAPQGGRARHTRVLLREMFDKSDLRTRLGDHAAAAGAAA